MKPDPACACVSAQDQGRESSEAFCESLHQIAESLGNAIDAKDVFTSNHSRQVADLSRCLALRMGLPQQQADLIHIAGHMHDIGKIGVPDEVLAKQGPLTKAEWDLVKKHPVIGAKILAPVQAMNGPTGISKMVLHHHERWDGRGYPFGLRGTEIPLGARVQALADSFSAMMESRPYRPRLALGQVLDEIERCAGSQFDPAMSMAMTAMIRETGCLGEACGVDLLVTRIMCRRVLGKGCSCSGHGGIAFSHETTDIESYSQSC